MAKEQIKPAVTLSDWARTWGGKILAPVVKTMAQWGISPNALTLAGLSLNAGAAILLANRQFGLGGGLILFAGIFDSLDGSVARLTGRQTRFGAFLDSTLDRYSEALVFIGLAWACLQENARVELMLILAALAGSLMVSYTRARAEGLGLECKGGLLTRFERVVMIGLGLIAGLVQPMLWAVTILTHLTAFQRIWIVWRAAADDQRPSARGGAKNP